MKVLYLTGMYSTKYGGIERINVSLLKNGINLSLVYYDYPASKEYTRDLISEGGNILVVKGNRFQRMFSILKTVRFEKPDIIHYHFGSMLLLVAPIVFVFFKIPQVYTIHCEIRKMNLIREKLYKLAFRCLDLIICVSNGVKSKYVSAMANSTPCVVSYLGVDKVSVSNSKINIKKNKEIILTSIGFDIFVKGFDILVEAIAEIAHQDGVPAFKVVIIGLSSQENERFIELVKFKQVEDFFISVGISNEVANYLAISDIYIQPSRTEAISLSIMEALSYGLPIIASNVGGIPEVCVNESNGLLFHCNDSTELAKSLLRLLKDPGLRSRMGVKSKEMSRRFTVSKAVLNIIKIYNKILNDKI